MTTFSSQACSGTSRRHGATRATTVVLFFWVVLVLSQELSTSTEAAAAEVTGGKFSVKSLSRKARVFHRGQEQVKEENYSFFHAPSVPAAPVAVEDDLIYGDDKRLIHTGPNPLHN